MTYVITESCIDCKDAACTEVCPVDCIYDGGNQLAIDPEECIDCGACEPECPVEAVLPDDSVYHSNQEHMIQVNAEKVRNAKINGQEPYSW